MLDLNREYFRELNFQIDEYLYNLYFFWVVWDISLASSTHNLLDEIKFHILDDKRLTVYNILISLFLTFALSKRTKIYNCFAINGFSFFLSYLASFGMMCLMISGLIQYINISYDDSAIVKINMQKQNITIDDGKASISYVDNSRVEHQIQKVLSSEELVRLKDAHFVNIEYGIHAGFFGAKWINTSQITFEKTMSPR